VRLPVTELLELGDLQGPNGIGMREAGVATWEPGAVNVGLSEDWS